MESLGARTALAPTALRRTAPAKRRSPLARRVAASGASTEPAVVPDVDAFLRDADAGVLHAWRAKCPELQALWDLSQPETAWEGVTFGEAGGADEGRVVGSGRCCPPSRPSHYEPRFSMLAIPTDAGGGAARGRVVNAAVVPVADDSDSDINGVV